MFTHWPLALSDSVNHGQTAGGLRRCTSRVESSRTSQLNNMWSIYETKWHSSTTLGGENREYFQTTALKDIFVYLYTYIYYLRMSLKRTQGWWWWVKSPPLSIISTLPNLPKPLGTPKDTCPRCYQQLEDLPLSMCTSHHSCTPWHFSPGEPPRSVSFKVGPKTKTIIEVGQPITPLIEIFCLSKSSC